MPTGVMAVKHVRYIVKVLELKAQGNMSVFMPKTDTENTVTEELEVETGIRRSDLKYKKTRTAIIQVEKKEVLTYF